MERLRETPEREIHARERAADAPERPRETPERKIHARERAADAPEHPRETPEREKEPRESRQDAQESLVNALAKARNAIPRQLHSAAARNQRPALRLLDVKVAGGWPGRPPNAADFTKR